MTTHRAIGILPAILVGFLMTAGCGTEPAEAFRLYPEWATDPSGDHLHGYRILETKNVDADLAARIRRILDDDTTYGTLSAACWTPGMGLRLGEGESQVEVVICLKCNKADFYNYKGNKIDERLLSDDGVRRLKEVYEELFQ